MEKTEKDERGRRRGRQRMRRLDGITNSVGVNLSILQEIVKEAWCVAVNKVTKCWAQLND